MKLSVVDFVRCTDYKYRNLVFIIIIIYTFDMPIQTLLFRGYKTTFGTFELIVHFFFQG